MDDLLIIKDLVKHYPIRTGVIPRTIGQVHAVDTVSFSVGRGKTLGLVGESGCGKSTLGKTVIRLTEPTSGQIIFDGVDITALRGSALRKLRREMQIVFQDPFGSLNPRITAGSAIAEPLIVHGVRSSGRFERRREAARRTADLLELVGLPADAARRYPHEFSGGQRQRIAIARALALDPRFIVCDEAVSSLDMSIQAQILNLLVDLQQRLDLAYLFIAHDLSVVRHISHNVAIMYLGEIVEEAATEDVFSNPLHPYTKALLASIPVPVPGGRRTVIKLEGDAPSASAPPAGCRFHTRCPLVIPECKTAKPPLVELQPGHRVACIRAGE